MALKKYYPDITFSGNKVTPDEMGFDQQYIVSNPSIDAQWFGTMTAAGTSTIRAWVGINTIADYPRNMRFVLAGSAAGMSGTSVVNGLDQFGSAVTESLGVTSASNGGTTVGTQIFAQFTSGTVTMGTAVGSGTPQLGVGTAGTTTLFGLPARLGGTTDIKNITGSFNGVGTATAGTFVFGGTPSSAANTAMHAFKAPRDLAAGTVVYRVNYRPSFVVNDEVL